MKLLPQYSIIINTDSVFEDLKNWKLENLRQDLLIIDYQSLIQQKDLNYNKKNGLSKLC